MPHNGMCHAVRHSATRIDNLPLSSTRPLQIAKECHMTTLNDAPAPTPARTKLAAILGAAVFAVAVLAAGQHFDPGDNQDTSMPAASHFHAGTASFDTLGILTRHDEKAPSLKFGF